jgi:hypothetical protein
MGKKPRIKEYHEPAGGWGAAKATAAVLLEQQVLFKGAAALYSMNSPVASNARVARGLTLPRGGPIRW